MPDGLDRVEIYTDGGCEPNPGPGGWGAVLISGARAKEIYGAEAETTNNRMELTAAIRALTLLRRPCEVEVYTDSTYLRDGITGWVAAWQKRDWHKSDGSPVENTDLWRALLEAQRPHTIQWHWVRGHRGHRWNERADQLATQARHELQARLQPQTTDEQAPDRVVPEGELPEFDIYARGCALGNPGPGGYGALVIGLGGVIRRSGGWPVATNNVMDLWAIISALQSLPGPSRVTLHSPSKYVIDAATRWLSVWERSGWRTSSGMPVKNREMWEELSQMMGDHDIQWHYLPAAQSSIESESALALARQEAARQRSSDTHR